MGLRCCICEDLSTVQLAAFRGQIFEHDGRGWIATWDDSKDANDSVPYTNTAENVTDMEDEDDEPEGGEN
jgi:hypothetical protein